MKIAIRGGHNPQSQGAAGIVNEVTEDRKIYASVIKYLKLDGNEVMDVTPGNCVSSEDLTFGVNKANAFKADVFTSIHLNAGGGKGIEVLHHSSSTKGKEFATRVCDSIAKLGFTNRGAKADVRGLYELNNTAMAAIIVEVFFCDSQIDVDLYNELGVDPIGKAIAEGIVGHTIQEKFSVELKVVNEAAAMIEKPIKVFKSNDLITAVCEEENYWILDIGGKKAYLEKSKTSRR